jgi:ribosomal protein L16 Arg81 hydroxylase
MLELEFIEQAIKEKRIHVWKNRFPEVPSLENWLNVIAKYSSRDLEEFPEASSIVNDNNVEKPFLSFDLRCRFWTRLTVQLCDKQDPLENDFKELRPISEWVMSVYGPEVFTNTFAFMSFIKNRGAVGLKHTDTIDQFQWQCYGETIWRTGEDLENEYIIRPGDFLFIPKGIIHEIETSVAPRAAINFAIRN